MPQACFKAKTKDISIRLSGRHFHPEMTAMTLRSVKAGNWVHPPVTCLYFLGVLCFTIGSIFQSRACIVSVLCLTHCCSYQVSRVNEVPQTPSPPPVEMFPFGTPKGLVSISMLFLTKTYKAVKRGKLCKTQWALLTSGAIDFLH